MIATAAIRRVRAMRTPALLPVLMAFAACSSSKSTAPAVPASVTVSPTALVLQLPGSSQMQLAATVKDQGGATITNPSVTWASADTTVAKVSASGLVTGVANGNTQITAKSGAITSAAVPVDVFTSSFNIVVRFTGATISDSRKAAFDSAAERWERIIVGDIPNVSFSTGSVVCAGDTLPAINEVIDDIVIYARIDSIDGPGKILGEATPCFVRIPSLLPLVGIMHFDKADVSTLEANGQFGEVVLHEMGHVLGFGVIWDSTTQDSSHIGLGLLSGATWAGGTDPHFTGTRALAVFDSIGGTSYTGSSKVPVENKGGTGTADSHWRDSVFHAELMTGFLNQGVPNPLSALSAASMQDLGYTININESQPYSQTFNAPPLFSGPLIPLQGDVPRTRIYGVDAGGGILGVIRR